MSQFILSKKKVNNRKLSLLPQAGPLARAWLEAPVFSALGQPESWRPCNFLVPLVGSSVFVQTNLL